MSIRQSARTPIASRRLAGRREPASRRRSAGFNLLELMVVLAVGAILTGIGVSSYRYVTYSNRVSTEVNSLLGDLMLARSEAIKQGVPVITCPLDTGPKCKATTSWEKGWMIFADVDNDGAYTSGTDVLIRVQNALTSGTDTFTSSDTTVTSVKFNREGFAVGLPFSSTENYVTFTLHTSPQNNQWTRCVQITSYGGLTTERYGKGGCT
jgi:type IV fimbrial biogenesis protein FimT